MNKRKLVMMMGVLALIMVLGVAAVGTAFAQTTTPPAQATPETQKAPRLERLGRGFGFGFGGRGTAEFDAVAGALGLTPTQLFEELHSGKTLAEIAEAKGVDLQAVQDAVKGSRVQAMKDAIAKAVEEGKMTQDKADWLLQGIEKGYVPGGHGFGFDGGRGHGRGMRGFGFGGKTPSTSTPAPGTSS